MWSQHWNISDLKKLDRQARRGCWDWLRNWAEVNDVTYWLCSKAPESLPHVLAGCPAFAQNKYLSRHNAALKVLFFKKLRDLELIDAIPPWYSSVDPKPVYECQEAKAFWDVPVYAEHSHVKQNREDARFTDFKKKEVVAV